MQWINEQRSQNGTSCLCCPINDIPETQYFVCGHVEVQNFTYESKLVNFLPSCRVSSLWNRNVLNNWKHPPYDMLDNTKSCPMKDSQTVIKFTLFYF